MISARTLWRAVPRPLRARTLGIVRSLSDRGSADRAAAGLLAAYAVLWSTSATIRNLGLSIQGDMAEAFALSRTLSLGYLKHPPLINYVTAAWFATLPVAHWSFYLLACLNAAIGMWAVWLAAGLLVDRRRQIVATALLGLAPVFTFHAATLNHNTIQLSLWPLVALTFLLSIQRSELRWSILFGIASALAILGKYFAGLIVVASAGTALLHPQARAYLTSSRPYVAALTCAVVLAPNLYWLAVNELISIKFQISAQPDDPPLRVAALVAWCIAAYVAYLSPAWVAIWWIFRPWTAEMLRSTARDWPPLRRCIACIAFAPAVLALLAFAVAGVGLNDAWLQPALFFVPLAIVSAPALRVTRRAVTLAVGSVAALATLVLLISPLLMVLAFLTQQPSRVEPSAALARTATDLWRARTGQPLASVSGSFHPSWQVSFYSADHPALVPSSNRLVAEAQVERTWREQGVLAVCRKEERWCNAWLARALPTAERIEITLPVTFLGMSREPATYVLHLQRGHGGARGSPEQP